MSSFALKDSRLAWLYDSNIRPYVFVRPENRIDEPGQLHSEVKWFPHSVLYKNPLEMDEVRFADRILHLEARAFAASGLAMPRWVFYDCAIVPGFVAGFAARVATLPQKIRNTLAIQNEADAIAEEWAPLSLFIIIPTMSARGEWVAHNLCTVNSLLPKEEQFYGMGYLSKAFGLWYANVRTCCGMTQWTSPAIRLHSHYGPFEILTAFTPVHSYSHTLTYRVEVDSSRWGNFFVKPDESIVTERGWISAGFELDPVDETSLINFQRRLERREGPFFLDGTELKERALTLPLKVFRRAPASH